MAFRTKIEWTDASWNPVTGCTKIIAGCDHCYAERIAERFRGSKAFPNGFDVTLHKDRLTLPSRWRKPRRVFVNSMSDLFHKDIPRSHIDAIFDSMEATPFHTFQILTKRSSLMRGYMQSRYAAQPHGLWRGAAFVVPLGARLKPPPPPHIWLGVSVELPEHNSRIHHLRQTPTRIRFLSIEPLLAPMGEIDLTGIHWVIVGGESGAGARPMNPDWARDIRDQCAAAGVPFFMKQMAKKAPIPDDLMVREYPAVSFTGGD